MHLKSRGGESLYCRHCSYDDFRDVVHANITNNLDKASSSLLTTLLPTHELFVSLEKYCFFSFSKRERREKERKGGAAHEWFCPRMLEWEN